MTEDLEFVTESGVPAFKNMLQPSSLMYCHGTYLSIILSRVCVREKVWAFHVCSRNMCASTYTHTHTHTHTHRSHKKESHDCFPESVLLETKHALTQSLSETACSTGRRRLIGSLIFIVHFPQKWRIFSGSVVVPSWAAQLKKSAARTVRLFAAWAQKSH